MTTSITSKQVKIGDTIVMQTPSGKRINVIVSDVIRDCFERLPIAIEFKNRFGEFTTLSIRFFPDLA